VGERFCLRACKRCWKNFFFSFLGALPCFFLSFLGGREEGKDTPFSISFSRSVFALKTERERERDEERLFSSVEKVAFGGEEESCCEDDVFSPRARESVQQQRCAFFSLSLFLLFIKVLTHLICSSLTGRNKLPPLVPPRSCSSTPPRRTPKSWVSRSKTASRTPRLKSLFNRSFRTADRLSTSRRTVARTSRLLTVDWRRTLRDRTLGARRLRVNRASTSRLVGQNKSNIEALRLND
jgi:hypothetical protein